MFLKFNNTLKKDKRITIINNNVIIQNSFIVISKRIDEKQFVINNNFIQFSGNSEFITDKNNPQIDFYANIEHAETPRNTVLGDSEVELFVDNNNNLSYVNDKKEKTILVQGVFEK